ncbi:hypothetical protein JTB14_021726 [Gonioctena quinquepunctata]|nr:hypothetical protein JTB14_021726 [Gonioctena quinquepunctata]
MSTSWPTSDPIEAVSSDGPLQVDAISSCDNDDMMRNNYGNIPMADFVENLDEVYITLETCEELRVPSTSVTYNGGVPSKYSFIHKVIDGITISVNAVNIVFNSPAFTASVQVTISIPNKTFTAEYFLVFSGNEYFE